LTGRIPRYFIDDLLARVDIVDLIDKHVPLKKAGANFVARCPFHTEKTPSFSVNRNKQFFHCFGCGASGNAIGFLMDFNHLDFIEAVEDLATFVGIEVPRETTDNSIKRPGNENSADDYRLLEQVALFYEQFLRTGESGRKAVSYLKSRGIDEKLAKEFMLGFAPDEWRVLLNNFDQGRLIRTGMAIEKDGKVYDRFRGRLMFPIRDKRGRVVGFGGRVLDETLPKYLNSPETTVFHKSKEVYGLHELLGKDSKPKRIIIVEGYMDVITLAGNGVHYVVATLGTATSQAHLDLLFRFSSELVFCFDGDNAGREAAWRAMEPAFGVLKDGRQIRILLLPQNHDPDSLVREEGAENFEKRISHSQALSDYFFMMLTSGLNLDEVEGRSQLMSKAKPYFEKLTQSVYREMMYAKLKELTRSNNLDDSANSATLSHKPKLGSWAKKQLLSLPRRVIALLVQNPQLIEKVEQKQINWDILRFDGVFLFKEILSNLLENKPSNTALLLECYRNHPNEKVIKSLASLNLFDPDLSIDANHIENEFNDALEKLLVQARKEADYQKLVEKGK
jgi:DNA primase